ncbi:MAG: uroporphyrinogen-III synthase [Betaproteobacteria bacterium]
MPDELPLAGLTILVTRPRRQGEATAAVLRAAGAAVFELPVLEISSLACTADAVKLSRAYAAIFVSANAVEHGMPCLQGHGGLRAGALIASIGHATTVALNKAGFAHVVSPQQSIDSEGLLAMPQLQHSQVKGQHIILVRGRSAGGGRKLLEETLTARGAIVEVLECYERRELMPPREQVGSLVTLMKANFAIMVLSVETLDSVMKIFAGHEALLKSSWLLVPHARVAAAASARGFQQVAEVGMSAEVLLAALIQLKPRLSAVTS